MKAKDSYRRVQNDFYYTTANFYKHLEDNYKTESASVLEDYLVI